MRARLSGFVFSMMQILSTESLHDKDSSCVWMVRSRMSQPVQIACVGYKRVPRLAGPVGTRLGSNHSLRAAAIRLIHQKNIQCSSILFIQC
ncbi:hypothetical protein B0J11DRAFT_523179 [Dendryphion nanum]|uniref:Uncharacterized protein n=1 Tax=Dendryphion nanum TaxID=256645 RepID=A0A9P9ITF1_9PLEO|nr:hypothetical protein B0J11DRAFT_523179 [Dendryphion nanum]